MLLKDYNRMQRKESVFVCVRHRESERERGRCVLWMLHNKECRLLERCSDEV